MGTRELLEQVTDAISSELDSIEGMAAHNRPGAANRSAARCAPGTACHACNLADVDRLFCIHAFSLHRFTSHHKEWRADWSRLG